MKHYRDIDGNVYGFKPDDVEVIELTEQEFHDFCNPKPTPEQLAQQAKAEAQAYLDKTDHKFYGDYEPKEGEDLEAIRVKRSEARALLREEVV